MKTVTFEVRSLADTLSDFAVALETGTASEPRIAFETPELLFEVLTPERWRLLAGLRASGPVSMDELARRVGRDVAAVSADARALLRAGIVRETAGGKIEFPYDAIHVDFMLRTG
jgi:predicted transcriptional regulator